MNAKYTEILEKGLTSSIGTTEAATQIPVFAYVLLGVVLVAGLVALTLVALRWYFRDRKGYHDVPFVFSGLSVPAREQDAFRSAVQRLITNDFREQLRPIAGVSLEQCIRELRRIEITLYPYAGLTSIFCPTGKTHRRRLNIGTVDLKRQHFFARPTPQIKITQMYDGQGRPVPLVRTALAHEFAAHVLPYLLFGDISPDILPPRSPVFARFEMRLREEMGHAMTLHDLEWRLRTPVRPKGA